jgi:hypothetical protein
MTHKNRYNFTVLLLIKIVMDGYRDKIQNSYWLRIWKAGLQLAPYKVNNVHILSITTFDVVFSAFRYLLLCASTALLSRSAINIRTIFITNLSLIPTAERMFQNL